MNGLNVYLGFRVSGANVRNKLNVASTTSVFGQYYRAAYVRVYLSDTINIRVMIAHVNANGI